MPNDGKPLSVALEQGEAVSLHLPPDGLRVLAAQPWPRRCRCGAG